MDLSRIKLDRSKPFSTSHGDGVIAPYWQGGLPFDLEDNLIEGILTEAQKADLAKKAARRKAKPEQEAVEEPEAPVNVNDENVEGVNLSLWLRGKEKYLPAHIRKAVKERYGVNKSNLVELAEFLVEQKVVPRSEVHPSILPPEAKD
jgi:hypothetical protein